MNTYDLVIAGGGIIGIASAYQINRQNPDLSILVLEKEISLAAHQSSRNSGVIHSGVYYKPGSLKATMCRRGRQLLIDFCNRANITYEICGKLLAATNDAEAQRLDHIFATGTKNQLQNLRLLESGELNELEPHVNAVRALHVPEAGIVNYGEVAERMASSVKQRGVSIANGKKLVRTSKDGDARIVHTEDGDSFRTKQILNCTGLHSDKTTRIAGETPPGRIVPFRGEFYQLKPEKSHLCKNMIYPVPDPSLPFLGVHFTRNLSGTVKCGPNAVLAFSREGYKLSQVKLAELYETLTYSGFRKLALTRWQTGLKEMMQTFLKSSFVRSAQKLLPEVTADDLVKAPSGVRAQLVSPRGDLVDDFRIIETAHAVHICNAPSPAATASLAIGEHIANIFGKRIS